MRAWGSGHRSTSDTVATNATSLVRHEWISDPTIIPSLMSSRQAFDKVSKTKGFSSIKKGPKRRGFPPLTSWQCQVAVPLPVPVPAPPPRVVSRVVNVPWLINVSFLVYHPKRNHHFGNRFFTSRARKHFDILLLFFNGSENYPTRWLQSSSSAGCFFWGPVPPKKTLSVWGIGGRIVKDWRRILDPPRKSCNSLPSFHPKSPEEVGG